LNHINNHSRFTPRPFRAINRVALAQFVGLVFFFFSFFLCPSLSVVTIKETLRAKMAASAMPVVTVVTVVTPA
jgi:hypothetical protein